MMEVPPAKMRGGFFVAAGPQKKKGGPSIWLKEQ